MARLEILDIFRYANMTDKLPLSGVSRDEELRDMNRVSTPEESVATIVKALLSNSFTEHLKDKYTGYILVHFPRTVVTNEYDKSTVVKHLYVKVPITANGVENGLFTMNRSEYTVAELYSNYMHSHASTIPTSNFKDFVNCCLGSGPLNHTQSVLSTGFDGDRWNIFCLELSKYVEVESVAGTPYHRLENINFSSSKIPDFGRLSNFRRLNLGLLTPVIREFLSYYLDNNNLTFSFRNGVYSIGMPFIEYLIHISNSFIEWVNSQPALESVKSSFGVILDDYVVRNGELYQISRGRRLTLETYRQYVGREVCTFKGKPVTITITDLNTLDSTNQSNAKLINPVFASYFLNKILITINYRYGRNQKDPSSVAGKVRYKI